MLPLHMANSTFANTRSAGRLAAQIRFSGCRWKSIRTTQAVADKPPTEAPLALSLSEDSLTLSFVLSHSASLYFLPFALFITCHRIHLTVAF